MLIIAFPDSASWTMYVYSLYHHFPVLLSDILCEYVRPSIRVCVCVCKDAHSCVLLQVVVFLFKCGNMYIQYICIYECMYVSMYIRTYVCMYVCMNVCMYVCTYVRAYICMNMCTYVYTYVCIYVRMYVYFHVEVRMYVCTYVRTYVHTYLCGNVKLRCNCFSE